MSSSVSIVLNSSNYDSTTGLLTYNFPFRQQFKGKGIGIQNLCMYNSTPNITPAYGNNTITLVYPFSTGNVTYNFTIPTGYYSMSDLNYFLQSQMIANNLYMINGSGQYVYFVEIVANSTQYAGQMNFYPLPTSAQATTLGYTLPVGQSLYGLGNVPQLTITSAFGNLIGLNAGTYGSGTANIQYVSTKCPIISPVNAYVLTCNLVNNVGLSNPSNVLGIVPINAQYGGLITLNVNSICYQHVANNSYANIQIGFLDQNLNKITPYDADVIISLSLIDMP
jgi:hypothetical protein